MYSFVGTLSAVELLDRRVAAAVDSTVASRRAVAETVGEGTAFARLRSMLGAKHSSTPQGQFHHTWAAAVAAADAPDSKIALVSASVLKLGPSHHNLHQN